MAGYSIEDSMALIAGDTVIALVSSANSRPRLFEFGVSSSSAPNDYSAHFKLTRFDGTTSGTGTGLTEDPLDPDDPTGGSDATGVGTYTLEPTTAGASPVNFGINQRTWYRWVASPGKAIIVPATANAQIGLNCVAVSTAFTAEAYMHYDD